MPVRTSGSRATNPVYTAGVSPGASGPLPAIDARPEAAATEQGVMNSRSVSTWMALNKLHKSINRQVIF